MSFTFYIKYLILWVTTFLSWGLLQLSLWLELPFFKGMWPKAPFSRACGRKHFLSSTAAGDQAIFTFDPIYVKVGCTSAILKMCQKVLSFIFEEKDRAFHFPSVSVFLYSTPELKHLSLGHCSSYLTHSYLLNREDQPESVGCACPLTVQHIMIDCVEFAYIRSHFLDVRNMKDLFNSVTPSTILLYVSAIGLFFKMWLDILPLTLHSLDHNIFF